MNCYQKDYPRLQHVRKQWENLNGTWDFMFDEKEQGLSLHWQERFPKNHLAIQVPYTYETAMSGIGREEPCPSIWYHRILKEDALAEGERFLIHFEGSDFLTRVWVNGQLAGTHQGGYSRFTFDVTDLLLEGENHLTVQVTDSLDTRQPRGKQRWLKENYGCWYVQTTGIWKTVWAERVSAIRLEKEKMTPLLDQNLLKLELVVRTVNNVKYRSYYIPAL